MDNNKRDMTSGHPIRVVSKRTGLKSDRIRAWEHRYGAVKPARTATGRRLYSDEDIERLILLGRLIAAGWRISDIARKSLSQLKDLNMRELKAHTDRLGNSKRSSREQIYFAYRGNALDSILKLDSQSLDDTLKEAVISLSPIEFRNQVLVPLLTDVGVLWRSGDMRIVHEHFATAVIRTFIDAMRHQNSGEQLARILISTPAGQIHELGALMAAAAVEEVGWEAEYLGANLPAEEIAAGAAAFNVRAVAVSVIFKGDDKALIKELREIRRLVDPQVALIIGGRAVSGLLSELGEIGWVHLENYKELRDYLEMLLVGAENKP